MEFPVMRVPLAVPNFPVFFTESSEQLDEPARQAIAQESRRVDITLATI